MARKRLIGKIKPIEKVWLTRKEACAYTGLSRTTLIRWCNEAKLSFYKVTGAVLIKKEDIDRLIENSKVL